MSLNYGRTTILGKRELQAALGALPARVVKRIMDLWVLKQARAVALLARRSAPRDRNPNRNKPASARLWKSIQGSRVRKLQRFPHTISRAIAYGARTSRQSINRYRARARVRAKKGNARRKVSRVFTVAAPRAYHFNMIVAGTKSRRQKTTGRYTGSGPPHSFFSRAGAQIMNSAGGEVGAQLRDAYDQGIQREIRRLARKYT